MYKDIFEFQDKNATKAERINAFGQMTLSEAKRMIQTCGTPQGKLYYTELLNESFSEKWTIEEYKELIKYCLMHFMSWPEFHNNPENSQERIEQEDYYIHCAYSEKESPMAAAVEVGFGCG